MDGKEQIIQKILLDAQTAAQKKINSANVKAEETVSKAKFDAEKEFGEAKAVVDKNAELYLSRNNTAALMEQKRTSLGTKQNRSIMCRKGQKWQKRKVEIKEKEIKNNQQI